MPNSDVMYWLLLIPGVPIAAVMCYKLVGFLFELIWFWNLPPYRQLEEIERVKREIKEHAQPGGEE